MGSQKLVGTVDPKEPWKFKPFYRRVQWFLCQSKSCLIFTISSSLHQQFQKTMTKQDILSGFKPTPFQRYILFKSGSISPQKSGKCNSTTTQPPPLRRCCRSPHVRQQNPALFWSGDHRWCGRQCLGSSPRYRKVVIGSTPHLLHFKWRSAISSKGNHNLLGTYDHHRLLSTY